MQVPKYFGMCCQSSCFMYMVDSSIFELQQLVGGFKTFKNFLLLQQPVSFCVIGDLNARVGKAQSVSKNLVAGLPGVCEERESKDPVIDSKGRKLLSLMDEVGGIILNGGMPDDKHGEMTFCGAAGSSVIDYAISSFDFTSWVNSFYISLKEFSDHMPLTIILSVPKKIANATLSICPEKLLWKPKRVFKYVDLITQMPSIDFTKNLDSIDDLVSALTDK